MDTFLQGRVVSKEDGASSEGTVYDRWLRVQVTPEVSFPVFDRELLSDSLEPGSSYTFILAIAVPLAIQIEKKTPTPQDLQVIVRSRAVSIDGASGRATPVETDVRNYPVCGVVRELSWQKDSTGYLSAAPELSERRFVSIETAFGLVLMDWESLEPSEQAMLQVGDLLTWSRSRLDLLGAFPASTAELQAVSPRILSGSDDEIINRMGERTFVDILRESGETWNRWRRAVTLHGRIDLSGADLSALDLSSANLSMANLTGANLSRANLNGAHLERATLEAATLDGATLRQAQLVHAILNTASLTSVDLTEANLEEASLWSANLSGATLHGANLQMADLSEANLQGADLHTANFSEALLDQTNLVEARYTQEQLALAASAHDVHT